MTNQQKLTTYYWQGKSKSGVLIRGEQNSLSRINLQIDLRKQGILPTKIRKKSQLFKLSKISPQEITAFTRQIATMLEAGIPVVQALELIAKGNHNPLLQTLIVDLKTAIENGSSVAQALQRHPKYFNDLYRNLVSAGEQSGALDVLFARVASYKEKTDILIAKIKKALFYPAAIISVAIIITTILLIFIVPQFQQLFANFGAQLPAPTRAILNLSHFLQSYGWLVLITIISLAWIFNKNRKNSTKFAYQIDNCLLKLPLIGSILQKATLARFARTLGTTFAAGLPLIEALTAVAGATGNRIYNSAIFRIREDITTGLSLHTAICQTFLFPPLIIQMITIGEESGTLEKMLHKIADIYEREVDHAVDNLSSLLEPVIMVILGVIIGGLVIALYLPIFKLGSVV